MKEFELKYGCNPNQKPAKIYMADGSELPVKILSGRPGYINFLDAFNGWQLVSNLKKATGLPAATSFKHVSPAGAAVGLPLTETLAKIYWVNDMDWKNFSPLACAYARARGADRMSSFGDFISLSDVCDKDTALLIKREVSDGVIAPGYTEEALEILKQKKKGNYNVIQIDENFVPAPLEHKEVFGVTFEQGRQELAIDDELISNIVTENKELTEEAKRDLKVSLIALKYTQSNSVCFVKDGQAIGVGAGQQSRVHCTRLAGQKADNWYLRQCPKVLNLPFKDTITRAERDNAIDVYIGEEYMDVLADFGMLPGESLVREIVLTWKTNFGTTKIFFDVSMAVIAAVLSLGFAGHLNGVREGTVIAALQVGFITRVLGKKLPLVKPDI